MKKKLKHYNSIFISDIHLGSEGCQAEIVNSFLKNHSCDNLFLVGDIIDGWKLSKRIYWPKEHSLVVRQVINKQKHGANVVYLTGNHDEFLRDWSDISIDIESIEIKDMHDYHALNGKRYLVIHGDLFDGVHKVAKWLSYLGDNAYSVLLNLNKYYNKIRHSLGFGYWSLSAYLKANVKGAVNFIFDFESTLSDYCKSQGYDGVICGHIHTAVIKQIDGVEYMNSGDWVESCTALVENTDGTWEIINWTSKE
jgi:UDP-2,3-diacylglucosamine pyrophosphatase LpxH